MKKITSLLAAIALSTFAFAQNTYTLDKNHARLAFSAFHYGISHIEGNFKKFDELLFHQKKTSAMPKLN